MKDSGERGARASRIRCFGSPWGCRNLGLHGGTLGDSSAILSGLLALAIFASPAASPATESSAPSIQVDWNGERLSVSTAGVPLVEALRAVADKTGLEILGIEQLEGSTKAHFAELPLRDGLRLLLADVNFALQGPSSERPHFLLSIASGRRGATAPATATSAEPEDPFQPAPVAGYVAEEHRHLYRWAQDGDLESLRQAALSGDVATQTLALRLLAEQDAELATELAAAASRDTDPNRRLDGLQILGDLDNPAAAAALGDALADPSSTIRRSAVEGLMGQTSDDAVRLLDGALFDPDESVRSLALELLAQRGAEGIASIDAALGHSDPGLRARARELLEQMPVADDDAR